MIFVFDENISPKVVEALQVLQYPAQHSTNLVPRGATDQVLFRALNPSEMCLVTQDQNMARKSHQREAILSARLRVFIFTGDASKSLAAMALLVQQVWPQLENLAQVTPAPFIFGISDRKRFERLDTPRKPRRRR